MATKQLNTRIVLRNDTAARWSSENPVLRKGEIGIVFDPSVESAEYVVDFKVGDGVKTWNQLPLFRGNIGNILARLDALESTTATHTAQINSLETRVTAAESDIDDLQFAVATHTSQISGIVDDVSALSGRVTNAESAISALQSAASSYATHVEVQRVAGNLDDEITRAKGAENDLLSAISINAAAISTNAAAISTNAAAISANATAISQVDGRVDGVVSDLGVINNQIATHSAQISAANSAISANTAAIATHTTQISAITVSIATINTNITSLSNDVGAMSESIANRIIPGISANAAAISANVTAINALDARVDVLEGNHFIIAQATGEDRHPDVQDPVSNAIYLVPKAEGQGYCEWLYLQVSEDPVAYSWEEIGDTDIDLSDYATKAFVTGAIAGAISDLNISKYATHGEVTAVSNALASEVSRATAAEAALDSRLDTIEADYLTQADSYILDCGNAQTNIN